MKLTEEEQRRAEEHFQAQASRHENQCQIGQDWVLEDEEVPDQALFIGFPSYGSCKKHLVDWEESEEGSPVSECGRVHEGTTVRELDILSLDEVGKHDHLDWCENCIFTRKKSNKS